MLGSGVEANTGTETIDIQRRISSKLKIIFTDINNTNIMK